jgi:putative oxidoreductase
MLRLIRDFEQRVDQDARDLIFRGLFSTIFLGLGSEHLLDDRLIQHFMPAWVQYPILASRLSGVVLLVGGLSILTGYRMRLGARLLGAFLIVVTLAVHVPGCFHVPPDIGSDYAWLWIVFQRSNLVKNVCLFGVCVHLTTQAPGRFSVDGWRARRLALLADGSKH